MFPTPKALAAEKPGKKEENTRVPTPKANNENAAPVLPKPNPKPHTEYEKGKGKYEKGKVKGKGKDKDKPRGRSPSVDRKTIPCVYHFQKGGCSKGKDCPYSHSKKKGGRGSSSGPGNGKGTPRNDRSASPRPKSEKPCFLYAKGQCTRSDCPYKHDSNAAPAEGGSAKAKAAVPKGKAKAAAAKAKSAAVVVQVKRENDNGYLSDWSDNEDSSPVAAGRVFRVKRTNHVRKDKIVKIKRKPELIKFEIGVNTNGLPKRTKRRETKPRYVKGDFLESETFKHQAAVDQLIARARAKVLNNDFHGRKPEIKVLLGKDIYVKVRWKNDEALQEMVKSHNRRNKNSHLSCASAEPSNKSVRFIMDTGCGHDLISQRKVKELGLETFLDNDGMTFMTANGLTDSNEITIMDHEGLGQCKLHVLNQTPAVLSIGSRCSKEGYSFVWPEGEEMKPAMINEDGVCTFLEVDGDIPYLIPGSIPKDDELKEYRTKLISHLESLINKLKERENGEDNDQPKAAAGESPGEDLFGPSDEEVEEPARGEEAGGERPEGEDAPEAERGDGPPVPDARPDEDHDGLIEVDVDHGSPRYAKPGSLKREAKTLDHLMTHRYSNPYCDSCIRAKMRHFKTRKNAFKRKLSKFGDLITFDFVDMGKALEIGWRERKELLVIRDRFTGMVLGSPVPDKSTETVVRVIREFIGDRKVVYTRILIVHHPSRQLCVNLASRWISRYQGEVLPIA